MEFKFDTLYKYPLYALDQIMYVNEEKISLPEGVVFGNAWYKFDIKFDEWEIR